MIPGILNSYGSRSNNVMMLILLCCDMPLCRRTRNSAIKFVLCTARTVFSKRVARNRSNVRTRVFLTSVA